MPSHSTGYGIPPVGSDRKKVVLQETHRTPTAAAERAENFRRRAMEGALLTPAAPDESEQAS
jgi:hypothetical protein